MCGLALAGAVGRCPLLEREIEDTEIASGTWELTVWQLHARHQFTSIAIASIVCRFCGVELSGKEYGEGREGGVRGRMDVQKNEAREDESGCLYGARDAWKGL